MKNIKNSIINAQRTTYKIIKNIDLGAKIEIDFEIDGQPFIAKCIPMLGQTESYQKRDILGLVTVFSNGKKVIDNTVILKVKNNLTAILKETEAKKHQQEQDFIETVKNRESNTSKTPQNEQELKESFIFSVELARLDRNENDRNTRKTAKSNKNAAVVTGCYTYNNGTTVKETSFFSKNKELASKALKQHNQECILFIDKKLNGWLLNDNTDRRTEKGIFIGKAKLYKNKPGAANYTKLSNKNYLAFTL